MSKLSVITGVFFFVVFSVLVSAQTQSGQWSVKAGDSGYNLDINTGERAITIEIPFKNPYDVKPKVCLLYTSSILFWKLNWLFKNWSWIFLYIIWILSAYKNSKYIWKHIPAFLLWFWNWCRFKRCWK